MPRVRDQFSGETRDISIDEFNKDKQRFELLSEDGTKVMTEGFLSDVAKKGALEDGDVVPALMEPGEMVMNRNAVNATLPLLESIQDEFPREPASPSSNSGPNGSLGPQRAQGGGQIQPEEVRASLDPNALLLSQETALAPLLELIRSNGVPKLSHGGFHIEQDSDLSPTEQINLAKEQGLFTDPVIAPAQNIQLTDEETAAAFAKTPPITGGADVTGTGAGLGAFLQSQFPGGPTPPEPPPDEPLFDVPTKREFQPLDIQDLLGQLGDTGGEFQPQSQAIADLLSQIEDTDLARLGDVEAPGAAAARQRAVDVGTATQSVLQAIAQKTAATPGIAGTALENAVIASAQEAGQDAFLSALREGESIELAQNLAAVEAENVVRTAKKQDILTQLGAAQTEQQRLDIFKTARRGEKRSDILTEIGIEISEQERKDTFDKGDFDTQIAFFQNTALDTSLPIDVRVSAWANMAALSGVEVNQGALTKALEDAKEGILDDLRLSAAAMGVPQDLIDGATTEGELESFMTQALRGDFKDGKVKDKDVVTKKNPKSDNFVFTDETSSTDKTASINFIIDNSTAEQTDESIVSDLQRDLVGKDNAGIINIVDFAIEFGGTGLITDWQSTGVPSHTFLIEAINRGVVTVEEAFTLRRGKRGGEKRKWQKPIIDAAIQKILGENPDLSFADASDQVDSILDELGVTKIKKKKKSLITL